MGGSRPEEGALLTLLPQKSWFCGIQNSRFWGLHEDRKPKKLDTTWAFEGATDGRLDIDSHSEARSMNPKTPRLVVFAALLASAKLCCCDPPHFKMLVSKLESPGLHTAPNEAN